MTREDQRHVWDEVGIADLLRLIILDDVGLVWGS